MSYLLGNLFTLINIQVHFVTNKATKDPKAIFLRNETSNEVQ